MRRLVAVALVLAAGCASRTEPLTVCSDPNNLPFSNRRGEGFENEVAAIVADELGRELRTTWWAQRRGMIREALNAKRCDLVPGVAAGLEMLATTRPYYRSAYVAVTRAGDRPIETFDDPRLKTLRIGVQMIGDDFANTPPAHALARRGLVDNVRGYMVYGDYAQEAPQSAIVQAVAKGEIDVAFVWGPVAGYFAQQGPEVLQIEPLGSEEKGMTFGIAMGVRKEDKELKEAVDTALANRAEDIRDVLQGFGVPLLEKSPPQSDNRL